MVYDPDREVVLRQIVDEHISRVPRGNTLGPAPTIAEAAIGSAARKAYEAGVRATEAKYGIHAGIEPVKSEDDKNDDQGENDE